jgi:rod shape-determining protein MreD
LQTSVPSALFQRALAGNQPDFLFILTIFLAMTEGIYLGAIVGFISGFILDCFATQLGINAFNLLIFGYVTGLCEKRIFFDHLLIRSLFIFILTLMSKMLLLVLTMIHAGGEMILLWNLHLTQHWYFLPSAAINVVLAIPIFRFLQKPYAIGNYDEQQVERE